MAEEKQDITIYVIVGLLLAWTGGFYIGEYSTSLQAETVTSDTVVVVKHDTIISYEPFEVVRYVYNTRIDTLRTTDSIYVAVEIPIETAQYSDTIASGNDTLLYNAFISGYKPKLDSLQLFHNKYERTVIQTIKTPEKKWHWGITGGYFVGYDVSHKQISNGLGVCVGMNYRF